MFAYKYAFVHVHTQKIPKVLFVLKVLKLMLSHATASSEGCKNHSNHLVSTTMCIDPNRTKRLPYCLELRYGRMAAACPDHSKSKVMGPKSELPTLGAQLQ